MSVLGSQIHSPVVHEQPLRQPPHIIDVDADDADDIVYVGLTRPNQRRRVSEDGRVVPVAREVINVVDDEDDNEIQFISHNPARPRPPLIRRERIFSPPPPSQVDAIPPVPRIPQRFLASHPRPPGPIIPDEDPFPFEADLLPPAERAPIAAPPSHHVPVMGFGGALLAGVRRIMGPRNASHRPERLNSWGVPGSFIMRWDPFDFTVGGEDDFLDGLDETGFLGDDGNPYAARRVRSQIERVFKQRDHENQAEPDYKPDYTHPDRPLPGFTHDFSLSSSPPSPANQDHTFALHHAGGSGSRLCEATLVCAACRDPLVLGAFDVGEGRAKRRLWGLRCGHLLDGKCLEKLMEPALPAFDPPESSTTEMAALIAKWPPQDSVADSSLDSLRSRLRPRRGIGSSLSVSHPVPAPNGRRGVPKAATHRSNRKGKGKMKAPVVEAEHEWSCPVNGCGRVHLSLLTDGRWTMDEKRGGIAVFV